MHKIFYSLFAVFYLFLFPGYLLARVFLKGVSTGLLWITGVALAVVLLPVLAFGLAMFLHTVISAVLLFVLATGINLILLLVCTQSAPMNRS